MSLAGALTGGILYGQRAVRSDGRPRRSARLRPARLRRAGLGAVAGPVGDRPGRRVVPGRRAVRGRGRRRAGPGRRSLPPRPRRPRAPGRSAPAGRPSRGPCPQTTPLPSRACSNTAPTTSYGLSAPCSNPPPANGGAQPVSAQIGGLSPNATYHFRLLATTPRGSQATADGIFTTSVSSAVRRGPPTPVDQRNSGRRAEAHLPERGVLHQRRAPGVRRGCATSCRSRKRAPRPTPPKAVDGGGHLQCRVTATNGGGSATATSSFVTIPPSRPLVSSGETAVGRASWRSGRVHVPVLCSPKAEGACSLLMRATAPGSRGGAATLGHAAARLSPGQHQTLSLALASSGRRLLARQKRIAATLTVTGTVIGVIRAALSSQTVLLVSSGHGPRAHPWPRAPRARRRQGPGRTRGRGPEDVGRLRPARAGLEHGRERARRHPLHGLGQLLRVRRALQRVDDPDAGQPAAVARAGAQGLPLRVARRRLVAGLPQLLGDDRRQPRPVAARAPLAHQHAPRRRPAAWGSTPTPGATAAAAPGRAATATTSRTPATFASWGIDAVKVDFCGGAELHLNPVTAYSEVHAAIAASHRPMLLNICNFLQPEQYAEGQPTVAESAFGSYAFGPGVANSWRTDTDVGQARESALPGSASQRRRRRGPARRRRSRSLERPRLPRPRPGDVGDPVPLPVLDVVDPRGSADDQRRPHAHLQGEPRDGVQLRGRWRSTRTTPASRGG